jgi:hypothetical protein
MTPAAWLVLATWGLLCAWVASRLVQPLLSRTVSREWQLLLFMALLPTAVLDELIAKPRIDAACAERTELTHHALGAPAAAWLPVASAPEKLAGFGLPVQVQRHAWHDRASGNPVVSLVYLEAGGGKLARLVGRPGDPLTFKAACHPPGWAELQARLGLPPLPSRASGT